MRASRVAARAGRCQNDPSNIEWTWPVKRSDTRERAGSEGVARSPAVRRVPSLLAAAAAGGAMAAGAQAPANEQQVSLPYFVQFNTVCLRCHEGQCSGRLSFDSAADSRSHILRYSGRLTDDEIREMYVMPRYMKEQCGYYPLLGLPGAGRWTAAGQLRSADQLSYFVPLGALQRREYRVRLRFEADASAAVRVTSATFDEVVNAALHTEQGELVVRLRPSQAAAHYLHLHLDRPVTPLEIDVAAGAVGAP